ncbi:PepSY domain-containing protein [Chryseolinea lacunae]|uniref:PepSY domain-containing protein n=1 Tax=Chryseolinea lacunae TaxID=2801331 RepID=A0ABS1L0N2_9BACT|nr:PepSY domain-containing protein [Chryseolinea lacunae]MBL0745255.1 hypothetical protein [Chryseolinea lacunae]
MTKSLLLRKAHRYLGLFIGIQFLGWTISGLYFSWNNIDNVHGDHLRKPARYLAGGVEVVPPSAAIRNLAATQAVDSLHSVQLISLLGKPVYQLQYFSGHVGEGMHLHVHHALADATTGALLPALNEAQAVAVARENLVAGAKVASVQYLASTDPKHEYREKPLPAWAVSFSEPACTAYVSAELGTLQAVRHDQWRAFDFLWMFHTMDYATKDNFNNVLLKIFSLAGLVTVVSGFALFIVSSRTLKRITRWG